MNPRNDVSHYVQEISRVQERSEFNSLMKQIDETFMRNYSPQESARFPFGGTPSSLAKPGDQSHPNLNSFKTEPYSSSFRQDPIHSQTVSNYQRNASAFGQGNYPSQAGYSTPMFT